MGSHRFPIEVVCFVSSWTAYLFTIAETEVIQQWVCNDLHLPSDHCNDHKVESVTSHWSMYIQISEAIPSILVTTILGAVSDKYGRKPIILLALVGQAAETIGLLLVAKFHMHVKFLCAFHVVYGLCGGFAAGLMAYFSSVADLCTKQTLTRRVSFMEAAILFGGLVGTLFGGHIAEKYGFYVLLICNGGLIFATLLYTLFLVAESLPADCKTDRVNWNEANIVGAVRILFRHRSLAFLAVGFTLIVAALVGPRAVMVLYLEDEFDMGRSLIGDVLSGFSAARGIGLLVVLPLLTMYYTHRCHHKEYLVGQASALLFAAQFGLIVLATSRVFIYLCAVPGLAGTLTAPVIRSFMSQSVRPDEQGKIFAAIAGLECLTPIVGTLVFTNIYSITAGVYNKAAFFSGIGLLVSAVGCLFGYERTKPTSYATAPAEERRLLTDNQQHVSINQDIA
eukprot:m.37383 g.37383  ORF g.37383 m.37383 type:complete len:451 (+) comp11103_c0_seq3:146-1498(+)